MDTDENDLLFTNQFVAPFSDAGQSSELSAEFRKYYELEQLNKEELDVRDKLERTSIRSIHLDEDNDADSLMQTNRFEADGPASLKSMDGAVAKRSTKEVKTFVSIDSRDRNKVVYSQANHFKIFLGKTFRNVKSIRLASMEFPNTNAVINSKNNNIYWINKEDIDDDVIDPVTKTYPVYGVQLRVGSYIVTSLQNELQDKLSKVKRRNKFGDYHYFEVDLDIDTDVVTFTSLTLTQLGINPFAVTTGVGLVTVEAVEHGFQTGDTVYIVGAKNLAGIAASTLNGPHEIVVINPDQFQYEVNVKAGETAIGAGNTVKVGKLAPFQFQFGTYDKTIAPNIGFPFENSSQRIDTHIRIIENFPQVQIVTREPHNLRNTSEFIGQSCIISDSGTTPVIDGNRILTKVIDPYTVLVSVNAQITFPTFDVGTLVFGTRVMPIRRIAAYNDTVLITTFTDNNFVLADIGASIMFYDTPSIPSLNGEQTIDGVLSSTQFFVLGSILEGGEVQVSDVGAAGSMPRYQPLTTQTFPITDVEPGRTTTLRCEGHNLVQGDKVRIYNLETTPSMLNKTDVYEILSVPDPHSVIVDLDISSFDPASLAKTLPYVGTNIVTLSFPFHGFNSIIDIRNLSPGTVKITTQLPHGFETNQEVRITNTNSYPPIDGGKYPITRLSDDEFSIPFGSPDVLEPLTTVGDKGIIGMSNNFTLYGAQDVGGIPAGALNSRVFSVREIVDEHTIKFTVPTSYASSTVRGGGSQIFISSLIHGFSGLQDNTKNNFLNRSINLEGENYAFLCCPQLSTMMNTGQVKDVFARVTLDQSPGSMVFAYLSNPKEFDVAPLDQLNDLEFSVVNYDASLYEFNDLDYSFVLEITEVIDLTEAFNFSSRRGRTND